MLNRTRARFSSAHILAALALFVALGGSAYALKANTVGTKALKNNAVKTKKIANNAVKTNKIANGAVTTDKIADNAVNGNKVDESTLGEVPAAANATSATNATEAANALQLEGRALQQVRGRGDGATDATANLLDTTFEQVLTEPTGIPTGGATLVVNASIEASAVSADQHVTCELRDDDGPISQQFSQDLEDAGDFVTLSVTGFKAYPAGTGLVNPQDISVFCLGTTANQVRYENGDLGIVVSPTGSGA